MNRWWWWILVPILFAAIYFLFPFSGQVVVSPGTAAYSSMWPRMVTEPAVPKPGELVEITVSDLRPWGHVKLLLDGKVLDTESWEFDEGTNIATWRWQTTMPEPTSDSHDTEMHFYSDCHKGCRLRGKLDLPRPRSEAALPVAANRMQTKLCVTFPNQDRNWHNRSGWVVDTTYAKLADDIEDTYWGVDELSERVHNARSKGLRVLIRVDYDRGQTVPAVNDYLALDEYLKYVERLANDERLTGVYGYIIGSGMNALSSSSYTPDQPITPDWYARVFSGHGEPITHTDNVVQRIRSVNTSARVIVGPVRPWIEDQSGEQLYEIDVPWLNYKNTLTSLLDQNTLRKAKAGYSGVGPDGFALNASGRVTAAELTDDTVAKEPLMSLTMDKWGEAQVGFRVFEDFLAIVNQYESTRGLPAYINATNTFTPDERVPPGQNYPDGWLTNAVQAVNEVPQIYALCWFLDLVPGDDRWDAFSLSRRKGQLIYTDTEFDTLLQGSSE